VPASTTAAADDGREIAQRTTSSKMERRTRAL
jgi:hypothetical protein